MRKLFVLAFYLFAMTTYSQAQGMETQGLNGLKLFHCRPDWKSIFARNILAQNQTEAVALYLREFNVFFQRYFGKLWMLEKRNIAA